MLRAGMTRDAVVVGMIAAGVVQATVCLEVVPKAVAQDAATSQLCHGTLSTVRVSDVKPGKMTEFAEAVAAQRAWYKAAGSADEIVLMKVIVQGMPNVANFSATQAMTEHTQVSGSKRPMPDGAFREFVSKYRDSSSVVAEFVTCIEKH